MNDQTPRDPQQPIDANDPTPQHPVAQPGAQQAPADTSAHTLQQPTVEHPAAGADAPRRGRGILKPVLIGAGAAAVVLAVAGIGIGVADALDDDGDDQVRTQPGVTAPMTSGGPQAPSPTNDDQGQGGSDDGQAGPSPAGPGVDASASEPAALVDAIDAAVAAADGEGATSVELERDGWKVDVLLADGTEVDVRVYADGREALVQQDDDDSTGDPLLDTGRIADIVDAAIAAAGGGTVDSIESEGDDSHAFSVQVDLGGDRDVDVDLAEDLAVVSVDD
ncbi:hypothetical protein GCM10009846_27030 [Agrococcus versicolor]|uniref:PepSY domain-containing protein n=1 Tax=Agrococcus versicolor TaxID=501482 RepID=A0ABN3AWS6_9MICO